MTSGAPDGAEAAPASPVTVLHFVTGGFSGATQVAVDLTREARHEPGMRAILVLRRKRKTPMDRVQALRAEGLDVRLVPGWSHAATILALAGICRAERPDVLMAHGFPEHILGRWAGWWTGVPALVQVEHNSRERYTAWRRAQAAWLSRRSARLVGVSEGVARSLRAMDLPADRIVAIPNGVSVARFVEAGEHPFAEREPGIVMAARFASQKDHATALRALALLRDEHGLRPRLTFAGLGSGLWRSRALKLRDELGLGDQVDFVGHVADLPQRLMSHQIGLLATHYEGMPLALIEAMAAGCVAIASKVPGVEELIEHGHDGLLFPDRDAAALAACIAGVLRDPVRGAAIAAAGRAAALSRHDIALTRARYAQLCRDAAAGKFAAG